MCGYEKFSCNHLYTIDENPRKNEFGAHLKSIRFQQKQQQKNPNFILMVQKLFGQPERHKLKNNNKTVHTYY